MNIAVIKHNPQGPVIHKYLFSVPEGVKLKAGDTVMCQTRHGEAFGWLVYDSFEVEGTALDALLNAYGAGILQPIIGVYELSSLEGKTGGAKEIEIIGHNAKEVRITMNAQITEIIQNPDKSHFVREKCTAEEYAKLIKERCGSDDVVVTDLKIFIRDE